MFKDFREFALKGNMADLAVGVIIGVAFGGLVQSLVNDILTPILGLITGGLDFSQMYVQLSGDPQPTLEEAREVGATLAYGNFITLLINFLIVAWVLFLVVRMMNRMRREQEETPKPPDQAPVAEDVLILREIRNALVGRGKTPTPAS